MYFFILECRVYDPVSGNLYWRAGVKVYFGFPLASSNACKHELKMADHLLINNRGSDIELSSVDKTTSPKRL